VVDKILDKTMLAQVLDVSSGDLDDNGQIKDYVPPVFGPYFERDVEQQSLASENILDGGPGPIKIESEAEIAAGWCPNGSLHDGVCKPFNNNRTHWMSTYGGVRNLPIHMAVLPGTHNSGFDKKASYTPSSEVCQDVSPHEQLNAGIRVLDIRVHHYSGYPLGDPRRFMIFHSATSGRTIQGDIINGVKSFHYGKGWDRRREVVILDFHQFRNFSSTAHSELIGILKTSLGGAIISPTYRDLSISQIWNLSGYRNVVVAYNDGARDPGFWPGVNQRWIGSNTPSESELKAFIDRVGNEVKPAGELRSIQAARYVLPFFVPKDMSGQLMSWFASGSARHPIMKYFIINSDWSVRHRLVDNIIYSNQVRSRALGLQDAVQVTPADVDVRSMPSAEHMTFRISDEHWTPKVALPPILNDGPHRLLICSDATRECVLDMQSSDFPMEGVRLFKGDAVAFVSVNGTRQWELQVRGCTPNADGNVIPAPCDGEKFILYTLSHGNYSPLVSLPAVAPANSVVLVVSKAPHETRICHAHRPDEVEHVIRLGEARAFMYNADTGRWSMETLSWPEQITTD
jgi:hypothetical protein